MKRIVIITLFGLCVILVVIVAGVFWYLSGQPLYKPGMVRRGQNLSAPLSPPAPPVDSNTWLIEPGIDLVHFEEGSGRSVLMVHGGPGMPFSEPMAALNLLTNEYRFHYYAQRGCGESTRPIDRFASSDMFENMRTLDRTLGLGAQLADIECVRQLLGKEKLILIGHSWGGFQASLYAAEFPEHVEVLILVAPANVLVMPQPDAESDLFASVRAKLTASQQDEFDAFMKDYMDFNSLLTKNEAELVAMNIAFGRYYADVVATTLPAQGIPGWWMVWAQYISLGQRHDYAMALAEVKAPALVLHGAEDLQSESASRHYADVLPQVEFMVIEGAGHFVFADQPEAFGKAVQNFLNDL